jgi:hypothetical protein
MGLNAFEKSYYNKGTLLHGRKKDSLGARDEIGQFIK